MTEVPTVGPTVGQIGELELLQRLFRYCPIDLVGDDAAVMLLPPGHQLVVTTDMLVDGVHFSDQTTAPEDVGWRAMAANLSDIAAMGAEPQGITVALSLPSQTPIAWVDRVYQGMADCLDTWGGQIIGGDLCRSDTISIAITALGSVEVGKAFYRHTAQPGQVLLATGYHGLSRAGLELLLSPEQGERLSKSVRQRWIQAHQRPKPRLDVVAHLRNLLRAFTQPITIAAMDSSDGLANAVLHLCQASGVGVVLHADRLPLDPALVQWVGLEKARDWCLYGGEDFELVLCLPEAMAQVLQGHLGPEGKLLGYLTADPAVKLQLPASGQTSGSKNAVTTLDLSFSRGFQHF
ncbi:thiamine-phosphate kinase [Phormidium sp. FACHB-1136]|uniref:thiamine-phosphate kinase n=1 Tax=Phormidium sp. FACHB-1136 TaxID=2692848 RepID=UPI001689B208|nr:thiamine-phosphate kinase [Phormidium sp. FACHB-1136]MBD2428189.1 thiamine-phosphate kinase [Phormidium sp. FACHB-1136]